MLRKFWWSLEHLNESPARVSNFHKNVSWPPINPFLTNAPLLYSLKTSENLRFSDIFRGYGSGTLVEYGLIATLLIQIT